ncbi:hypothetical protein [Amycolatopsis sp. lyj-346]|uniref:hypothetical protein n=1 Tax=Amycolatopsis sp. lyj-346 TaxID=2789289 RepID=UPI00397E1969
MVTAAAVVGISGIAVIPAQASIIGPGVQSVSGTSQADVWIKADNTCRGLGGIMKSHKVTGPDNSSQWPYTLIFHCESLR